MEFIDINTVKVNDIVKFINTDKTLVDGTIKKVSNECIGITIDIRQDTFMQLNQNQYIELILVHKREAIKCSCIILGTKKNGIELALIISIPKLILTIERRKFERIPIVMDMEYSPLPIEMSYEKLSTVEQRYFRCFKKTYTIDISAGGIYFVMDKNEVDINFALVSLSIKNEKIMALCEKIRIDYINDPKYSRVAFKYNDIQKEHRQLILDFVSEKSKESNKSNEAV